MSRIAEDEIGMAVLNILTTRPRGRATVRQLIEEVPKHVSLSPEDQTESSTRSKEEVWEQKVRNLKSHGTRPGNIFHEGFVVQVSRGLWEITGIGRRHVAKAAAA